MYLGDKKKGKDFYGEYNATYVPDLIKIKAGEKPRCGEVKNYSCFVRPATNRPAGFELNGGKFLCGNTEERLKHRVLGTRRRGLSTMEPYDHKTGAGYVPRHDGDYRDAIVNRKADVTLYVHESLGGMAPSADKHLRYLAREAKKSGCDGTDYTRSYTANSFVPFYAQRLSWASAGGVADGILASLAKASRGRLRVRSSGSP